ncbi:MAG: helix-turn-helix transcriptional regulator [Acidobacteriota bacterium]|nr:helix-turn-helix transcriptional regulator [Acidobacteriota bacterium]
MTKPQTITLAGEAYVVVPLSEYEELRNAVDEDARDAAAMRRVLEDPNEESVPIELVDRLLAGENPVRAWREYRGLTGVELAAAAGVAASYLSAIENRKKPGSINALKRLATALRVDVDDLI